MAFHIEVECLKRLSVGNLSASSGCRGIRCEVWRVHCFFENVVAIYIINTASGMKGHIGFRACCVDEAVKSEVHVEDTQYLPVSVFSGDELYAIERLGLGTAMFDS